MDRALEFHPAADIFPLMVGDEFKQLVADIAEHGLHQAITLHPDGRILDGRNRYRALQEVPNVEPIFETWDGSLGTEVAYVISLNLARRHLNESQRAMVGGRLATLRQGARTDLSPIGEKSQADAATLLNVGKRSVERARTVLDKGIDELIALVDAGVVPVSVAALVAELPRDTQTTILALVDEKTTLQDAIRRHKRNRRYDEAGIGASGQLVGQFRVIYADPPWEYTRTGLTEYGHADTHYPCMPEEDIAGLPIKEHALEDSVCFLWSTTIMLPQALRILAAWGFTYKAQFVWDKVLHNFGHYNSVRHELLLIGTRGACTPDEMQLFDSVQTIERGEHSVKPEVFRHIIDTLYPHGPRVELFARQQVEGWTAWGNQSK